MLIAQFGFLKKNSQSNLCTELVLWSKDKILNYGYYFKRMAIVYKIAGYFSTYKVTESWSGWYRNTTARGIFKPGKALPS